MTTEQSGLKWAVFFGVAVFVLYLAVLVLRPFLHVAALYFALTHDWARAIVVTIWGAGVVSSIDNFLRPRLVGDRVGLSEFAMFFALLGGVRAFGLVGIVLGPVIFATIAAIVGVLTVPANPIGAATGPTPAEP